MTRLGIFAGLAYLCLGLAACEASPDVAAAGDGEGYEGLGAQVARDVGPYGCVTEIAAGHSTFSCAGPDVSCPDPECPIIYDVEVPDECVEGGCGLILEIHGGSQHAAAIDQVTGMRERGGERGFIVVQPNGPYPFQIFPVFRLWFHPHKDFEGVEDDGYPLSVIRRERQQVTPLLHDFIQDAIAAYDVDVDDVHVTGFSQGGALTWDLLCAFPETFASGAPVEAGDPVSTNCFDRTGPERDIPVLRTHGLFDLAAPFELAEPRVADMEDLGYKLDQQRCYGDRDVGVDGEPCPDGTVTWFEADGDADMVLIAHTQTSNSDGIENCQKRFGMLVTDDEGNVTCFGGFPESGGHCYPGVGGHDLVYGPNGLPTNLFQWLSGCGEDPNIEPVTETILDFFENENLPLH